MQDFDFDYLPDLPTVASDTHTRVLSDCVIRWCRGYSPPGVPERGQHHNGPPMTYVDLLDGGELAIRWCVEPRDHRSLVELLSEVVTCREDLVDLMATERVLADRVMDSLRERNARVLDGRI